MIVVDASVWIDYFNGRSSPQTDALDRLLQEELLIVGDITLTEVLQGFRDEKSFRRACLLMESMKVHEMWGSEDCNCGSKEFSSTPEIGSHSEEDD